MTGPDINPTPTERAAWEEHLQSEPRLQHYARCLVYVPFIAIIVFVIMSL